MVNYSPYKQTLFHPELDDTLFQPGVDYSDLQLAAEAARLAYYRGDAQASEQQRLTDSLARVKFRTPHWLASTDPSTGAAGFAARRNDGLAIIAFRGTEPDNMADIETDLKASLVPWPESTGRAHQGFAAATRALREDVESWLAAQTVDPLRLVFTGHSLGAAMATLMSTLVESQWLITLGSPRVGNAELLATVKARQQVRLVDCCDIVTQLPPPMGGYVHRVDQTYITRDGTVNPPPDFDVEHDRLVARAEYLETQAWKAGTVLFRDLADHAPINYLRALFP